jgi:hypothetical protein
MPAISDYIHCDGSIKEKKSCCSPKRKRKNK